MAPRVLNLQRALSSDELHRAARFRFQRDRQRFVVSRGLLRVILGRYLDTAPGELCFRYGEHGKPFLDPAFDREGLCFNLSRSGGLALYAVARGREVGIDLERVCHVAEVEQIAERFFSAREKAALRTFPADLKHEMFFAYWTRREAFAKALGSGLSLPLDQENANAFFDVSPIPGEPTMLSGTGERSRESSRWAIRPLLPAPGYVAALVAEGHDWCPVCWHFPGPTGVCQSDQALSVIPESSSRMFRLSDTSL
jgi:4'-phosphopantetheinyl transferase